MFSKHQKYRKYNYISMLLEYEEEIWKKKQPTKCRCTNCKGKPGRFKLHEIEVFRYMDWLYQQKPEVEIHRREILISRHKYRSERRLSILEVVKRWSLIAAELVEEKLEKIFLQFAPHVGEKTARLFS